MGRGTGVSTGAGACGLLVLRQGRPTAAHQRQENLVPRQWQRCSQPMRSLRQVGGGPRITRRYAALTRVDEPTRACGHTSVELAVLGAAEIRKDPIGARHHRVFISGRT